MAEAHYSQKVYPGKSSIGNEKSRQYLFEFYSERVKWAYKALQWQLFFGVFIILFVEKIVEVNPK